MRASSLMVVSSHRNGRTVKQLRHIQEMLSQTTLLLSDKCTSLQMSDCRQRTMRSLKLFRRIKEGLDWAFQRMGRRLNWARTLACSALSRVWQHRSGVVSPFIIRRHVLATICTWASTGRTGRDNDYFLQREKGRTWWQKNFKSFLSHGSEKKQVKGRASGLVSVLYSEVTTVPRAGSLYAKYKSVGCGVIVSWSGTTVMYFDCTSGVQTMRDDCLLIVICYGCYECKDGHRDALSIVRHDVEGDIPVAMRPVSKKTCCQLVAWAGTVGLDCWFCTTSRAKGGTAMSFQRIVRVFAVVVAVMLLIFLGGLWYYSPTQEVEWWGFCVSLDEYCTYRVSVRPWQKMMWVRMADED